ncbi:transmembrane protein 14C-like [Strongylocentrotus purpuratus]|uniref:Transmembrane protein 14C n=1 Tax=Strongylocentrotus purpuratus TaxID=7668 RepID=A0A7M7NNA0_STRPU|nr:transmembrane protein 14C [Strongylocentrotus purpuratus]XP_030839052.1 transmembrane protein 14C-like [Strongylocentrotus purpuratus]|eukprot:XP_011677961.1 PREDICTED: transmembrane protein 14C isoform X1 [Strongylocentrotus purpuratus]
MTDILGFGYAALIAIGGAMGYLKAGSTMSLASGLLFGAMAGYGASLTSKNPNDFFVIFGTSVVLTGVMGYRFSNSGKFMPAGLVAALSLLMMLRYGLRMIK